MRDREKENHAAEQHVPAELRAAPVQFQSAPALQSAELVGRRSVRPDPRAAVG